MTPGIQFASGIYMLGLISILVLYGVEVRLERREALSKLLIGWLSIGVGGAIGLLAVMG